MTTISSPQNRKCRHSCVAADTADHSEIILPARAGRTRHSPSLCGCRGLVSRTKCTSSTGGGCWAS